MAIYEVLKARVIKKKSTVGKKVKEEEVT